MRLPQTLLLLNGYLTVATMPNLGNVDGFDISISNDSTALSMFASGYGSPPIQDSNSLQPHGIFDTYYEVYEFQFDGAIGAIGNTQPGSTGTGDGYTEAFDITVSSLLNDASGVHFDLFTVSGGKWDPNDPETDKFLVESFAPFSHDAEWVSDTPPPPTAVPEPGSLILLGIGLAGFSFVRRKAVLTDG